MSFLEEETQVILKEIKQVKETLDMTPADREDIIRECTDRLNVLNDYAPKMMVRPDWQVLKIIIVNHTEIWYNISRGRKERCGSLCARQHRSGL